MRQVKDSRASIASADPCPLLPRRPRRGSMLSGLPRAADDGGLHRKISPRNPQSETALLLARSSWWHRRGALSPAGPLPHPMPACREGEGSKSGPLCPVSLFRMHLYAISNRTLPQDGNCKRAVADNGRAPGQFAPPRSASTRRLAPPVDTRPIPRIIRSIDRQRP